MSEKKTAARAVMEQLSHCKILLDLAHTATNKVSEKALCSAALSKLNQALYFYCIELGLYASSNGSELDKLSAPLAVLRLHSGKECATDLSLPEGADIESANELLNLLADKQSWLSEFSSARLMDLSLPSERVLGQEKNSIFSVEYEEESEGELLNRIGAVQLSNETSTEFKTKVSSWLTAFESLIARQRASSLEC